MFNPAFTKATADSQRPDYARVGDRVIRSHGKQWCPFCQHLLHGFDWREVGDSEFAQTCSHCHRDVHTMTAD